MNVEFMLKAIETGIILLKYQVAADLLGFFSRIVKKIGNRANFCSVISHLTRI